MKRVASILSGLYLLTVLSACAGMATQYEPRGKTAYGYGIEPLVADMNVSIFKGNEYTRTDYAYMYTVLAAYEHCAKQGLYALASTPLDLTTTRNSTELGSYMTTVANSDGSTSTVPSYYTYPVSRTYPAFYATFFCASKFKNLRGVDEIETLARELVHPLTLDFKGGLMVKKISGETPFKVDDVIIRIDNARIEKPYEVRSSLNSVLASTTGVEVVRDRKLVKLRAAVDDGTTEVVDAGRKLIQTVCSKLPLGTRENPNTLMFKSPAICFAVEKAPAR